MLHISTFWTVYFITAAALLGLVFGSFANCAAWRSVHGESVMKGRSHCAVCGHTLGVLDLIPVISWLGLHGRCRYCGKKISVRYPLTEVICAAAFVLVLLKFDVSLDALKYMFFAVILLCVSLTDLDDGIIPDRFLLAGMICFIAFAFADIQNISNYLINGVIGAFSVSLPLLLFVLAADKLLGKETMGGADIKLFFVVGLFTGWQLCLMTLLFSCIIGIIFAYIFNAVKHSKGAFPFGPSVALSAFIVILTGQQILNYYHSFFTYIEF